MELQRRLASTARQAHSLLSWLQLPRKNVCHAMLGHTLSQHGSFVDLVVLASIQLLRGRGRARRVMQANIPRVWESQHARHVTRESTCHNQGA